MAKGSKRWKYILGLAALLLYILLTARSIPIETILVPRWISSLESNFPVFLGDSRESEPGELIPFHMGDRFGYISEDGKFSVNQILKNYISLADNYWAEYEMLPSSIQVMDPLNNNVMTISKASGYPLFLDKNVFIIGKEQNTLSALGDDGEELWSYDFPAPITCIDAADGYILVGTLDGAVILLNSRGAAAFPPFEPGGSRLSVILGCAISHDATRLAVISGIDEQRFLILEQSGDTYKVIYHEFLPNGYRRPVHICFTDNDSKVTFERDGGLGIYDINSRNSVSLNLEGKIEVIDDSGGNKYLYVITSQASKQMCFIAIRYPGSIAIKAPFKSDKVFFKRRDNKLYLGSELSIASFRLENK